MADSRQDDLQYWRGETTKTLEQITTQLGTLKEDMQKEHAALQEDMRTERAALKKDRQEEHAALQAQITMVDARLKPLERLSLLIYGFGAACLFAVPVIWLYASRINELLEKVNRLLAPPFK